MHRYCIIEGNIFTVKYWWYC